MFPGTSEQSLISLRHNNTLDICIQLLLDGSTLMDPKLVPSIPKEEESSEIIVSNHAKKVINFDEDVEISVVRNAIWRKAKSFYKLAMNSPDRLQKNLVVEFIGEEGIDAGALKYDFLEAVIRNVTSEMFETTGNPYKRVPRAEWGTERDFEMAGLMELLTFIISGSDDCLLDEFPRLEDVPRSAATYDLIELCEKV